MGILVFGLFLLAILFIVTVLWIVADVGRSFGFFNYVTLVAVFVITFFEAPIAVERLTGADRRWDQWANVLKDSAGFFVVIGIGTYLIGRFIWLDPIGSIIESWRRR